MDCASTLHLCQFFLDAAKHGYKTNKSFELFLYILTLKTALIGLKYESNIMIDHDDIFSFEDEFKKEFKESHPSITKWITKKTKILILSRGNAINKEDVISLFKYNDNDETDISSTFDLVDLALIIDYFDQAKKMLEKMELHTLSFQQQCLWYCYMFSYFKRKKNLNDAENIIIKFENVLNEKNVSKRHYQNDMYKVMKASVLNASEEHLKALNIIEECYSINIQKQSIYAVSYTHLTLPTIYSV